MMDSSPATDRIAALIFSACGSWEAVTGRKLSEKSAPVYFLQALKSDDTLWQHIYAAAQDHQGMQEAAFLLHEKLNALDFTPGIQPADILTKLGVEIGTQQLFMASLSNAARREELIKSAFASDSPAVTAQALAAAVDEDTRLAKASAFSRKMYTGSKVITYTAMAGVIIIIIAHYIADAIAKSSVHAYKGVTPDHLVGGVAG